MIRSAWMASAPAAIRTAALCSLPQARTSIAHHAAGRQPTLGDAPPLQLAPVEYRLAWRLRRYSDAARRRAVQDSNGRVGRVATEVVNGHQPAADNARAEVHAVRRKQGSIRRGVKFGEYSLVRIRCSGRVGAEGEIENRRVLWKARTAAQDLRKRQIVGPDKRHAIVKSLELALELLTPESGRSVRSPSP